MFPIIPITDAEAQLPFPELTDLLDEKCVPALLKSAPWDKGDTLLPIVKAWLAYSSEHIVLRFDVAELDFRLVETKQPASVWEDSCVEFFVEPESGGGYYNFEFNAGGVLHLAYGTSRHDREMATEYIRESVMREVTMLSSPVKDYPYIYRWILIARIPYFTFFRHSLRPQSGQVIRANFYKCGDKMRRPSYQSWMPIDTPSPDFHQPRFFGELKFQ